jgi:hypothetical protein
MNPYAYTYGNPINQIDPFGLRTWTMTRQGGGGVSALVASVSLQYVTFESNCEDGYKIIKQYIVGGVGLSVGLKAYAFGPSSSKNGGTVFSKDPDPISGISVSGPSLGVMYGGTLASASTDFDSYIEAYELSHGWMIGGGIFTFEGQYYKSVMERKEKCCDGNR